MLATWVPHCHHSTITYNIKNCRCKKFWNLNMHNNFFLTGHQFTELCHYHGYHTDQSIISSKLIEKNNDIGNYIFHLYHKSDF